MMLAGYHDVSYPGILRSSDPFGSVELHRVKLAREFFVIRDWDVAIVHNPFANPIHRLTFPLAARNCIKPPMNEHAETRVAEPAHPLIALSFWLGRGARSLELEEQKENNNQTR